MAQPPAASPQEESSSDSSRYSPGDVLVDKYELVRLIGRGGMGAVWIARNVTLDVEVAVKLLRADRQTVGSASRLLQEARAAARLGHPAIVRVFDFGRTGQRDPFIVMELLNGESLANAVEREIRLDAATAVQAMLPIADALAAAHAKRIVHRDLKTDNIFLHLTDGGRLQPKILDFGLARHELDLDDRLTQFGVVMGSPAYMSPEQAAGQDDVDYRADIWAFAVVLYELVTGNTPFFGSTYNALLQSIIHEQPVPTTDLESGDLELWNIIERGLAKAREERWESMRAMGTALARWAYERGLREDICGGSLRTNWVVSGEFPIVVTHTSDPAPPLGRASLASWPSASTLLEVASTSLEPATVELTSSGSPPASRPSVPTSSSSALEPDQGRRRRRTVAMVFGLASLAVVSGLVGWGLQRTEPVTSTNLGSAVALEREPTEWEAREASIAPASAIPSHAPVGVATNGSAGGAALSLAPALPAPPLAAKRVRRPAPAHRPQPNPHASSEPPVVPTAAKEPPSTPTDELKLPY